MKTFENYVVGNANELAHAAAMAIADGSAEMPVFIYGKSGLGKTHLLEAVANEIRQRDPSCPVLFIQGDQLVQEAIQATRIGMIDEYWERFREVAVVLVDDVQFLERMVTIQEYLCETLWNKKRVILVGNCLPENLPGFGEVLKNYFKTCFRVEVRPPDYETRVAIIRNIAAQEGAELAEEVVEYMAETITTNVCQIRGAMNKILAYLDLVSVLKGTDVDIKDLLDMKL